MQDCIKTMARMALEVLAVAALTASCDLKVVAADIDVEKAKPLNQGPTHDELTKATTRLATEM